MADPLVDGQRPRPWNETATEGWECLSSSCGEWGAASGDASGSAAHHTASTGHHRIRLWVGGWTDRVIDVGESHA